MRIALYLRYGPEDANDGAYQNRLVVEQQPKRARMCGFGDKDRRPITPPPCVRLIVTDFNTDKEVDVKYGPLPIHAQTGMETSRLTKLGC